MKKIRKIFKKYSIYGVYAGIWVDERTTLEAKEGRIYYCYLSIPGEELKELSFWAKGPKDALVKATRHWMAQGLYMPMFDTEAYVMLDNGADTEMKLEHFRPMDGPDLYRK